jgi:hypothetical protein
VHGALHAALGSTVAHLCALVAVGVASACTVSVPLEGKSCDEAAGHPCAEGYWCDVDTCRPGDGPDGPRAGELRGPCLADGTCNGGLTCLADTCLELDAGSPDAGTDDAGSPDAGADGGYDAGPAEDPLAGVFGEGVVGYWSFNENADGGVADYAGRELDGTMFGVGDGGQPGGPVNVIGTFFRGLRFDGLDDYVAVPDDPAFDFGEGTFALEAWVQTNDTCVTEVVFVSRWTPGMLWFISCWASEGQAAGGRAVIGLRDSENFAVSFAGSTVINDGAWHHIIGVRENQRVVLYVDGQPDDFRDASFFGNFDADGFAVNFGRLNAGDGRYAAATLDEVRVWSRALAGADVARLYATFSPGLRGHWSFERTLRNLGGALFPATVLGGASFVLGQRGVGLQLDGVDDSVAIADYPQTAYTTDHSLSLWFRTDGAGDAGVQLMNNEITSRAPVNVWLQPDGLYAHVRDSAGTIVETSVAGTFDDGAWHHVATAREGADEGMVTLHLWGDGVPATPATGALALTETALELRLGARSIEEPRRFAGELDELQVYNRALTDAEVQLLFDTNR